MAINVSNSFDMPIGAVFTPQRWARYCIQRFFILDDWLAGSSLCDPTAGDGALIFALCDEALAHGVRISPELVSRLVVCEKNPKFLESFAELFQLRYGAVFPKKNIHICDVIVDPPPVAVDCLLGNPPWSNFTDLPDQYKETLKSYFVRSNLVGNHQSLLLGSSRIDLAALLVVWSMGHFLRRHGKAVFFLPLSLFQNQGAHSGFRKYQLPDGSSYALREIADFNGEKIFDGVNTRFGLARFERDAKTMYPVPYFIFRQGEWVEKQATPFQNPFAPLIVHDASGDPNTAFDDALLELRPDQKPRQGVNSCGAGDIFIFDGKPAFGSDLVFPLVTKECFRSAEKTITPNRFILIPHDTQTGKPLDEKTLKTKHRDAWNYLLGIQGKLLARRGTLVKSWVRRGYWWALLGVGPYNFAPFKVLWEAYGSRNFQPIILDSHEARHWQGNQAMHAYIPCATREEAEFIAARLRHPSVQRFLESTRTGGTCNWAQPGRMKQLMRFTEPRQPTLF